MDDSKREKNKQKLESIKKNIERTIIYWKPNAKRFHKFQRFVFKSSLSTSDKSALNSAQRPQLEFNIINSPLSRQCGEFSKQEPSIEISAKAGKEVPAQVLEFIDGHLRYILDEAKKNNVQYSSYRESLSGGYSSLKYTTEYENEASFNQIIKVSKAFDPTLVGFDPLAKETDKSDAEYYFEVFPMDISHFKKEYPKVSLDSLKFIKMDGAFNWSFRNQEQYVILVADYYEKVREKKDIVLLANNETMLKEEYEKSVEEWTAQGNIAQPPIIIDERKSDFVYIKRYRIIESEILEEVDTPFKHNNIVFVDGDSVFIQDEDDANIEQFTKPYVYHAEGLQKLTNFTGQVIGNDFENMVQHKFMIAEESLPTQETAQLAWKNVQQAQLLVYKAYADFNPDKALPVPQAVNRVGLPPEVITTFNTSMQMLQNILGSYDASLAKASEQQISGVAIQEAATLSNATAMPYIVNYMGALTKLAIGIVDLIPKINKDNRARVLPVIKKDGTKSTVKINQPGGIRLNYNSYDLDIKIEAGVNFEIAKNKAFEQLVMLMKVSPQFAEFMNDVGLEALLDNIDFRNADLLRGKVKEWLINKAQQKANVPNPEMIKMQLAQKSLENEMMNTKLKGEETSAKATLETEKLILDKQRLDNERLELMQKAGESRDKMLVGFAKAQAEEDRARADLGLKAHNQRHTHAKEAIDLLLKHENKIKENKEEDK